MCIIVAKPMGIAMPDIDTLERCFNANPDGAGFMYADGKEVRIRKGFMTFDSFENALYDELDGFDMTETAIVMHFRIATSGKIMPQTCHPFPISSEPEKLRLTRVSSRFGLAHNGVISGRYTKDGWSDTMDFTCDVVAPLMRMNPSFMHSSDAIELLEGACQSKLAIMDNSGEIALVGEFIDEEGVKYSNTSYLRKVYKWSSYGSMWADKGYYTAYPQYRPGYYTRSEDAWEKVDQLIEHLPYAACKECANNRICATTECECECEEDTDFASDYYAKEKYEEEFVWEL